MRLEAATQAEALSEPPSESASAASVAAVPTSVHPEHPAAASPLSARLREDALRRRTLALADIIGVAIAFVVAAIADPPPLSLQVVGSAVLLLPFWIVLGKLVGIYDRDPYVINRSSLDEIPDLFQAVLVGGVTIYLVWPLLSGLDPSRLQLSVLTGTSVVTIVVLRTLARRLTSRVLPPERCLIVGSDTVARQIASKLVRDERLGVELVGFVDETSDVNADGSAEGVLGTVSELERLCIELDVSRVLIGFSTVSYQELLNAVNAAKRLGLKISIVPRLFEGVGQAMEVEHVEGFTLHGLRGLNRTRSSMALKRAMDISVSACATVLLSPLLLAVAVAIKLTSPGPVFFAQRRIGRDNEPFGILKFRTMVKNADEIKDTVSHLNEASGPMFKIADDPRITRIGRFLRRYSIDELPQLLNVLRGEMSLVGPRPLIPAESDHVIGRHRSRLDLTPGLTGPWQVLGRTEIPFDEMVKLDYIFVAEWSLWNDVKLLMRTLPVVLRGSGQ